MPEERKSDSEDVQPEEFNAVSVASAHSATQVGVNVGDMYVHSARQQERLVPRQLLAAPRSFVGRVGELEALNAALRKGVDSNTMVIAAFVGDGGIGKTWLVLHWAHRNLDLFPDGQLFVDLHGVHEDGEPMSADTAVRGFLDGLGVPTAQMPSEPHVQFTRYRSLVAGKRMLIVLDNAGSTDQVVPLLPGTSTATVLITSRSRLEGLGVGHSSDYTNVDLLSAAEARSLLVARLGADRVEEDGAAVSDIVASCGGFPLALAIVAGRIHSHPALPLTTVAAELRDLGLGAFEDVDSASIRTVFSWSYRALTAEQRAVFGLLGIAPGPDIGLSAATSLTGLTAAGVRATLRALERASLLKQNGDDRYRMHDLVRNYAAECARQDQTDEDREAALRRVLDFYLNTASKHEAERLCALAGQQTALDHNWHQLVLQFAYSMNGFLHQRAYRQDIVVIWQRSLVAATRLGEPHTQADVRVRLGLAQLILRQLDDALAHLQHALYLYEDLDDHHSQIQVQMSLAWAQAWREDHQQSLRHATQALNLCETFGSSTWTLTRTHIQMVWSAARTGNYDRAYSSGQTALTLARGDHNANGEADALDSLGFVDYSNGKYKQALQRYQQALLLYRDLHDEYQTANTLNWLGRTQAALGQPEEARDAWSEALCLYKTQQLPAETATIQSQLDALDTARTPADPA